MKCVLTKALCALSLTAAIAFAGPNKSAELFIDLAPSSPAIDSSGACVAESSFTVGIVIHGAKKLFSYQCYVAFDTASLRFVSALKGNDKCPNFLESNSGSVFFTAKKSRDDSTRILIGCSLTGEDASQCVDGEGFLSLMTFKKLSADTSSLSLAKILVEDCDLASDTMCASHGAVVVPGTIGVLGERHRAIPRQTIDFSNGIVRLHLPLGCSDSRAIISDISGREIRRMSGGSDKMIATMKSAPNGIYFISIVQGNKTSSYPLFIKR